MASNPTVGMLGETGRQREEQDTRPAPREKPQQRDRGSSARVETTVSSHQVPRRKTLCGIEGRQETISLLALNPQRTQPGRPIPAQHLRNPPAAEPATRVVEQY
jgi:hypothetical protein